MLDDLKRYATLRSIDSDITIDIDDPSLIAHYKDAGFTRDEVLAYREILHEGAKQRAEKEEQLP